MYRRAKWMYGLRMPERYTDRHYAALHGLVHHTLGPVRIQVQIFGVGRVGPSGSCRALESESQVPASVHPSILGRLVWLGGRPWFPVGVQCINVGRGIRTDYKML